MKKMFIVAVLVLGTVSCIAMMCRVAAPPTASDNTRLHTWPSEPNAMRLEFVEPLDPGKLDQPGTRPTLDDNCLQIGHHEYEVCSAYILNASWLARTPYYKFGHSPKASIARAADRRLRSRYTKPALTTLRAQTAGWPGPEQIRVNKPVIRVISITVASDRSTAIMKTRETWLVRTKNGMVLFAETDAPHTITLKRVKGVILHKWVVTNIN